jgi:multiple sugar transport system permease protein
MVSGFNIFLLRQFFLGIPSELEQSAMIDGMSYFGIYLKIVMPLSKPILFTQGTFSFLWAWSNYLWPLVINSDEKYWVLTTGISSFSTQWTTDWNMVLTGTMVSIIPTIILFAVFQTHLIEGVKLSGMK